MDCERITPIVGKHIYLGSAKNAKDKKLLQELGIKYVLNCTPRKADDPLGCPNYFEKERLFVYKRIPIFDNKGEHLMPHMEKAVRLPL